MSYLQGGPRLDLSSLPVAPLNTKDFFFCYWSHMRCLPWPLCKRETALYCANETGIPWHACILLDLFLLESCRLSVVPETEPAQLSARLCLS